MNSFRKIITVIFIIIFCKGIITAQTQKEDTTHVTTSKYESPAFCIRATAGVGLPPGAIAYFRVDYGNVFFAIRACSTNSDDFGFIAGLSAIKKNFYWSIGVGISKVNAYDRTEIVRTTPASHAEIHSIKISSWGIPVQIDFMFTPSKFVGLGFVLFGDFNSLHNFGGVALCIQIGWLR